RLNKIATTNYKPIEYKTYDQYFHGFFKTNDWTKGINQETVKDSLLNRWAPVDMTLEEKEKAMAKGKPYYRTVQYYMSREFNKPENAYLKNATIKAFDQMNAALELGKVGLRVAIRPLSASEEYSIRPGDLRYTMVVLIEDIANSLLGYGPSVANPFTGEIVKAHTNMYKGTLERVAPRVYDGLIELEELEATNASTQQIATQNALSALVANQGNGGGQPAPNAPQFKINITDQTRLNDIMPAVDFSFLNDSMPIAPKSLVDYTTELTDFMASKEWKDLSKLKGKPTPSIEDFYKNNLKKKLELIATKADPIAQFKKPNLKDFSVAGSDVEKLREASSYSFAAHKLEEKNLGSNYVNKHVYTQYHEEMMNFDTLGKVGIKDIEVVEGIRDENGKLKDWTLLTDRQQRQLTEILVVHYYIPTLVHEIGHNLGLRHNFLGSADVENYYTAEEQKKLGLTGDVRYSSIMDYNYSSLNGLSTFGHYDLATLRFGYDRTLDTTDGQRVAVESDILTQFLLNPEAPELKRYRYCTDENAGASIECDRFDEGANDLELTNHYIETYYNRYKYANRKNRSRNFSEYGIVNHIIWINWYNIN
ncbi:MAG: zinc-dependent metalloprotease, partial [Bdellovibrionales bacterium]|nr:zinc-dependent metalloprotease [Bdellovibrionales bacterium]